MKLSINTRLIINETEKRHVDAATSQVLYGSLAMIEETLQEYPWYHDVRLIQFTFDGSERNVYIIYAVKIEVPKMNEFTFTGAFCTKGEGFKRPSAKDLAESIATTIVVELDSRKAHFKNYPTRKNR